MSEESPSTGPPAPPRRSMSATRPHEFNRLVAIAVQRGLVTFEQVAECQDWVQENVFRGSVILALFHHGYLEPEEVKKIIDLCLPESKGNLPELRKTTRKDSRSGEDPPTRETLLLPRGAMEEIGAKERKRIHDTAGHKVPTEGPGDPDTRTILKYTEVVGPYYVLETLGRGGMGRVVKAYHRDLDRKVALKFIDYKGDKRQEVMRRFEQEAKLAAHLHHPNIIAIYDVDLQSEKPYIAMEYVRGERLSDLIVDQWLTIEESLQLAHKLASALHYAHERGVVHRDVKPGNILVDAQGQPHLADFGLAKSLSGDMTTSGMTWGTLYYMSPEQVRRSPSEVGAQTDVFSLGVVLYEMLTSELPFDADEDMEILRQIVTRAAPGMRKANPKIDPYLEAIVFKALEKDPADRYTSARAFAEDLDSFISGRPISAHPDSIKRVVLRFLRRHAAAAAIVLVLLVLCGGMVLYMDDVTREAAARSERIGKEEETRKRKIELELQQANQLLDQGERWWNLMVAAQAKGDIESAGRFRASAEHAFDRAGHLLLGVQRGDPGQDQARMDYVQLLQKRLSRAIWVGDEAAAQRFDQALAALDLEGVPTEIVANCTVTIRTEPPGGSVALYHVVEREGRMTHGELIARGLAPFEQVVPAGRLLIQVTHPQRAPTNESVLLRWAEKRDVTLKLIPPDQLVGELVQVPGGLAVLAGADERPVATEVGSFLISRFEVRSSEYLKFLRALDASVRGRRIPRDMQGRVLWNVGQEGRVDLPRGHDPERPVTGISWHDAVAYARWLSTLTGKRCGLPNSRQWERAARAGDGRRFPWGDRFDPKLCVNHGYFSEGAAIQPAGTADADRSVYGVRDLAGSVREWVADWHAKALRLRMVRGGSYLTREARCRASVREGLPPDTVAPDLGFRVVVRP